LARREETLAPTLPTRGPLLRHSDCTSRRFLSEIAGGVEKLFQACFNPRSYGKLNFFDDNPEIRQNYCGASFVKSMLSTNNKTILIEQLRK
jgi:hypothetical protein